MSWVLEQLPSIIWYGTVTAIQNGVMGSKTEIDSPSWKGVKRRAASAPGYRPKKERRDRRS